MTDFGVNQALVEELFLQYVANPSAVPEEWRHYFDQLPADQIPELTSSGQVLAPTAVGAPAAVPVPQTNGNGHSRMPGQNNPTPSAFFPPTSAMLPFVDRRGPERRTTTFPPSSELLAANELQGRVSALINAFRVRGHLFAELDPLGLRQRPQEELFLERYGLHHVDPDTQFSTGDMAGPATLSFSELVARLKETYCRTIGVEFSFIEGVEQRTWLQREMESSCNRIELTEQEQVRVLTKLTDAEIFEQFLHKNYVGAKRFSLEGAESFIPLVDLLIEKSSELGVDEVVMGMAHRGRLNVLANIFEKKLHEIFAGFEDDNPEEMLGAGDVKYHLGYSTDRATQAGRSIHLTLSFNPSHLEFVAPVVEGRVRAKQHRLADERTRVMPLVVHGDSAFAGQGVVAETLNLAGLEGYETGGTIHVVINNQVGFTTLPHDSRTTRYCTDISRMLRCPVFHVNGEDPEAVAQVAHLACEFRQRFGRDVIIDLYCYRKYGHNEGDEPRFTQPKMYEAVDAKRSVRQVYVDRLKESGKLTQDRADDITKKRTVELEAALQETRQNGNYTTGVSSMQGLWTKYRGGPDEKVPDADTTVDRALLEDLLRQANSIPSGFAAHRKIERLFAQRIEYGLTGKPFDWGTAETLAYATLLHEGTRIRLTGQDSRRGTFSHRHAVIYDQDTGHACCPLNRLNDVPFEVWDSPLSEAGVLGFDFGFSLDSPDALCIWEAQFGDFANGAQVIIDQFLMSSEDKWDRLSGIVLLLPHGFEGQGPEHSSARLERFLQMCAEDNVQVCNLTTAAQIFHALRRQIHRPWRKPLIVMSPKSLLRAAGARSTLEELANGAFQRIIPDATVDPAQVSRVLLCSGKVYYDLEQARQKLARTDVAIIRLEQLYPLRKDEFQGHLSAFSERTELVWVQEEPQNMGAWYYLNNALPGLLTENQTVRCVSRPPSASPATGSKAAHELEQQMLIDEAFRS